MFAGCGGGGAGSSDTAASAPASTTPAASTPAAGAQRATFTLAISDLGGDLNPVRGSVASNELILHNVAQTLTEDGFDGGTVRPVPMLATKWTSSNDNKTWTFTLRDGVKFSNGEPFDASAVKFAHERFLDPKTAAPNNAPFIDSKVKVIDPHTVQFTLPKPNSSFPLNMSTLAIVAPKVSAADPVSVGKKPIGTGPFVVTQSSQDDFTMEINPDYWNKAESKPVGKVIHVVVRPDATARLSALQAGEVDVALDTPPDLAKQAPKVQSVPANENFIFQLNGQNGVFADPKMREAVAVGTDRESIRKAIYTDEFSQDPHCQIPPPGTLGYDETLQSPAYDPGRAKQLIDQSNYNGEVINIVHNPARYPGGDDVVQAVVEEWKGLGLNVKLQNVPYTSLLKALVDHSAKVAALPVGFSAFQMNGLDPIIATSSTDSGIAKFPFKEYPQVQGMINDASAAPDLNAQESAIKKISKVLCQSNAYLFLTNYDRIAGVANDVDFQLERPDGRIYFDVPLPVRG